MDVVLKEIDSVQGLTEVYGLTYREYLAAGYIAANADETLAHYAELDGIDETTVFGAYVGDELVGTNSLTVDGPMGLHVDHDFPDQVRRIRRWCRGHGLGLGASWRIVTDSRMRRGFAVLVELVRATVRKGCEIGLHVTLYSFHPAHERAYLKFLRLETIARDVCRAAGGNPAVLMLGDSRTIVSRCPRLGQPCLHACSPPRWPPNVASWVGGGE